MRTHEGEGISGVDIVCGALSGYTASSESACFSRPNKRRSVLAIGRSKVYDLLRSEELSSIRIGGSRRIPVSALHEFVGRLRSAQSA